MKRVAFLISTAGWLWLAAISPIPAEASVLQVSPSLVPSVDSNIVQVHCAYFYDAYGVPRYYCRKGPPAYRYAPYPYGSYGYYGRTYDQPYYGYGYYARPHYRPYTYYGYGWGPGAFFWRGW